MENVNAWLGTTGLKILVIVVSFWFARRFAMVFVERFIKRIIRHDQAHTSEEKRQREKTLMSIFHTTFGVILSIIAVMMILDTLGIEIAPLIASAGVVGVALGFGGQWLIKDIIAGLFIILENQYRVGDVVSLQVTGSEKIGTVEEVSLRTTMLRDLDGQLHHVPNGSILVASNLSMKFAGINLDLIIPLDQDIDNVAKVIDEVGDEITKDTAWEGKILEKPKFLRINDLTESHMIVKVTGKTLPLEQWSVSGELRKRLLRAFKHAKISLTE